ncbi:MAG: hypothetical protein GX425_00705, partial [Peptococcaceae bacterium]|nr:hypothetical protein [Peptococcaceae bacterium]
MPYDQTGKRRRYRYIEIQIQKCRVFLTPEEMSRLLQKDPELFAAGIRRGKAILRA